MMTFKIAEPIAELNLRVVAIKGNSKGPSEKDWPNTQVRVDDWLAENGGDLQFDRDDEHRYGIVLDSDMVAVDLDCHDGQANGYSSLSDIEEEGGPDIFEKCGLIIKSPSGGRHLFFRKDPSVKIPKSCKSYPAIDLLTEGAQVIGAGSTHVNGGEYVVEKWTGELTTLGEEFFVFFRPVKLVSDSPELDYLDDKRVGDSPRDCFDRSRESVWTVKAAMESKGYSFSQRQDHLTFVRPAKSDHSFSISGTLGKTNTNGKPYLKNFSTSDPIFAAESFSMSEAYKLVLGMDNHSLLNELEAQGYGPQEKKAVDDPLIRDFLQHMANKHNKTMQGIKPQKSGKDIEKDYPTFSFSDLMGKTDGGNRRPYLINGLLRGGEVMNIIASPKVGKSWLVYNMALSCAAGIPFLGYKPARKLKVLIADNELHPEELSWRVKQVAKALGVNPDGYIEFNLLRGSNVDIDALDRKLEECGGERFDIVVIDAFYRILPKGMSENDNASMTQIYNKLDAIASKNEVAIINIHHSSKGNQGDKGVTDVGAGAGAVSRAADTHMVIREHVDEGLHVIDAVTRSGMSPKPVTVKLNWPLWEHVSDVEPTLKTFENARDKMHKKAKEDIEGKYEIIIEYVKRAEEAGSQPNSTEIFHGCKLVTWGNEKTFKKHLKAIAKSGKLKELPPATGSLTLRYVSK
jgi:hypothetical protein